MKKWTERLPEAVYMRLCNCKTRKEDIQTLVDAKWETYKAEGKNKMGYTKEDALMAILELLDCNSIIVELTAEEYDELCR